MLLKTKILLSLGTLGISGGVGAGVYFLKNKDENIPKSQEGNGQQDNAT